MVSIEVDVLHIAFFPLMAPGHSIPMLDIAILCSARGVKVTMITTTLNAPNITQSFENRTTKTNITLEILPFPTKEAGLPEGFENLENATSMETGYSFLNSLGVMKDPLDQYLAEAKPDCLVADFCFSFAPEITAKHGIPQFVFRGTSYFSVCVEVALQKHKPQSSVSSDDEYFTIPHLPHEIRFPKSQTLQEVKEESSHSSSIKLLNDWHQAELKSHGVIFNSFHDLEHDYVNHFSKALGRRGWHVGPVSLCNRKIEEKSRRGKMASIDKDECMKWLDSKEPSSVLYVCFGSVVPQSLSLVHEITMGLEASELNFIWVIRDNIGSEEVQKQGWLPTGFEKRMEKKGLIIRGWAPQILILDHEVVGGFVTHCGWNSTLESISARVPMVTWPIIADQFHNEKLVTDVLRIGVPVKGTDGGLKTEQIALAMQRIMKGDEGLEMRRRASELKELAFKAVEEDGSSFCQLSAFIQELRHYRDHKLASSNVSN